MMVHFLKVKSKKEIGYFVDSVHKTENGAIAERKKLIDKGTYKPEELEVVTRFLNE